MNDRELESILRRGVERQSSKLAPEACGENTEVQVDRVRDLLPHSSHRRYRCAVRCTGIPEFVVFAKKAPAREHENMTRLYDTGDPQILAIVPRPLGYLPEIQYLLLEHVEGRTLMNVLMTDCLGAGVLLATPATEAVRQSGRSLARLQNALPAESTVYYDDERLAALDGELSATPYFAAQDLDRLRRTLDHIRPSIDGTPAVIAHGEFGPRNIIVRDSDQLALIDWPHLEVHNLFYDANLFLSSLLGLARVFPWAKRRLDGMSESFRDAYLTASERVSDPEMFDDMRLVNMLEILLRSHRRLRNARNSRVLRRAKSFIRYQKKSILQAMSSSLVAV